MGITNQQIYDRLGVAEQEQAKFRVEVNQKLDTLNGRVRSTEKDVGIALDRTKRIGQEIDSHQADSGAHGGATAKIHVSGNIRVALITLGGGIVAGGLLGRFFDVFSAYLH